MDQIWIVVPGSRDAIMVALGQKDRRRGLEVRPRCLPGKGHSGAGYTGAVVREAAGIRQYITLVGKGSDWC
jgi:hypothetical protein